MMATRQEDKQTKTPKWALGWEARTKLLAAVGYIFGVVSLSTLPIAALAYAVALSVLLIMRLPILLLLKRYLIITPFLLLMTVPLLLSQGLSFHEENALFAALILMKAYTSMTVISVILDTQSMDEFMTGLAGFKLPPVLITILTLSYRYVFLFLEDIGKMQTAAKSRFFRGGIRLNSLQSYGQLTAALIIRAIERSDRMYQAMIARGFTGRLHFEKAQDITRPDVVKMICAMGMIVVFVVVEKLYVTY